MRSQARAECCRSSGTAGGLLVGSLERELQESRIPAPSLRQKRAWRHGLLSAAVQLLGPSDSRQTLGPTAAHQPSWGQASEAPSLWKTVTSAWTTSVAPACTLVQDESRILGDMRRCSQYFGGEGLISRFLSWR